MGASRDDVRFLTRFGVAALAGWRVTHLLSREDGPAGVLATLRAGLGRGALGELMDCFHCTSVWVAAPLTLFVTRRAGDFVPTWLALSAAVCGIESLVPNRIVVQPANVLEEEGRSDGMLRSEAVGAPSPFPIAGVEDTV